MICLAWISIPEFLTSGGKDLDDRSIWPIEGSRTKRLAAQRLPPPHDPLRRAVGEGEDGEDGVEAAVGDVGRAISDEEVVVAVDAAVAIDDRTARAVAHAAGAGLVLAAVEMQARRVAPGLDR